MHLADGILPAPYLVGAAVPALAGVAYGLRRTPDARIPRVAAVSAALFVASLIHVPIGVTSVHLVLNGLAGLLLGWSVLPALAVALTLQALFFGHGGITVIAVNLLILGVPALLCRAFGAPLLRRARGHGAALVAGFAAGAAGVWLGALLAAAFLAAAGRAFFGVAGLLLAAHAPVGLVEGLATAFLVGFLRRVGPALLDDAALLDRARAEAG